MDKPVWEDGITPSMVMKHYGYDNNDKTHAVGMWLNDDTVFQKLRELSDVVERFSDPRKKIRIIFDYDPDFPRALLQIWGMSAVEITD